MANPLDSIRCLVRKPADAVRWACILEATAPKAGNVFPGRTFNDLAYVDFVAAAEITAKRLGRSKNRRVSARMLHCVDEVVSLTRSNVNLGIVLLLGPLVAADEAISASVDDEERQGATRTDAIWKAAIESVLRGFDEDDGRNVFQAISNALAGGLGDVEEMDVHNAIGSANLIEAMESAAHRDRIARQYAGGFSDLVDNVVPVVWKSISESGDALTGIANAHLRLLAAEPDSLIERKNGNEIAETVQKHARKVDLADPASIARFDASLRSNTHKLNPGTTADLIAAALYVLLRTPTE